MVFPCGIIVVGFCWVLGEEVCDGVGSEDVAVDEVKFGAASGSGFATGFEDASTTPL